MKAILKSILIIFFTTFLFNCEKVKTSPNLSTHKELNIQKEDDAKIFINHFFNDYFKIIDNQNVDYDIFISNLKVFLEKKCSDEFYKKIINEDLENEPFFIGSNHPNGKVSLREVIKKTQNEYILYFSDSHFLNREIKGIIKLIKVNNHYLIDNIIYEKF